MLQNFSTTLELANVGTLEITGITTCKSVRDTDSYDYEIETIELIEGDNVKDVHDFIDALFGEARKCSKINAACEVAMITTWGSYEDDTDRTTDFRQDYEYGQVA